LNYLQAKEGEGTIHFEIKATSRGDYINNLDIILNLEAGKKEIKPVVAAIQPVAVPVVASPEELRVGACKEVYTEGIQQFRRLPQKSYTVRTGIFNEYEKARQQVDSLTVAGILKEKLYTVYDFETEKFWNLTFPVA
jgi:hypothetical protein